MSEPVATLSGLFVYPLKSAGGIPLTRARVGPRGIEDDRRWMVSDRDGRFLSQRTHPRLALVRVRLEGSGLVLSAPGGLPELLVARPSRGAATRPAVVWSDTVAATPAGAEAAAWMSEHLDVRCSLVYISDEAVRTVKPKYSPRRSLSFADAFPFLLLSEASLADLNRRLDRPVPMDRFRPNLVVADCTAYAEDEWRRLSIGALRFVVAKPCSRCVATTVDQDSGERGREPLTTLATYRRSGSDVNFGQNLLHENEGPLLLGAPVWGQVW